ncbi:MAG: TetR/AcrR family transcriptional regulator [Actinomycetota bacterium]
MGPEGLTMRRLAAAVNQAPMNLYWRFRSKEELLDEMVDSLFAGFPERLTQLEGSWNERVKEALGMLRSTFTAHPKVLPTVLTRSTLGPNALRTMEELAKILRPDEVTSQLTYTLGVVAIENSAFREALPGIATPTIARRPRLRLRPRRRVRPPIPWPREPTR